MNKTFTTFASALVLSMAVVSTASARDGVYMAIRGGDSNYNMNDKKDNATASAAVDFNDVWFVSGALGYKYSYFRAEFEYIYRNGEDDEYRDPTTPDISHRTSLDSDSFMANAYIDFMPNYWISPYVSGGIGITRIELSNQDTGGAKETFKEDNFTWSVGAGLSLRLNKCLNLDAGYRYMDMGDIDNANINAHEWYGGLRFTF